PIFPYANYLEELSDCNLRNGISQWLGSQSIAVDLRKKDSESSLILGSLWHMFMRQSRKLKTIEIDDNLWSPNFPQGLENIMNAESALSHSRTFRCNIECPSNNNHESTIRLLRILASLCSHIQCMEILIMGKVNLEVITLIIALIRSQDRLTEFKLNFSNSYIYSASIIEALKLHKNWLTSLTFTRFSFDDFAFIGLLSNFTNLRSLHLSWCDGLTLDSGEGLSLPSLRHLENLYLGLNA
ncbi:13382_t:CDS:1, partial [Acaulospora morrowiae]